MSSPTPPNKSGKELPNEVRMLLAFVLMGLILVGTPFVYKRLGITTPQQTTTAMPSAVQSPKAAPLPVNGDAPHSEPTPEGVQAASNEVPWTLDTELYHIVFSNRGAVVKSWTLKNFKDSDNRPLELVNQKGALKAGYPFSWDFRGQHPSSDLNQALWVAHPSGDGLAIEYDFSDGRTAAKKTFVFQRDGYMVQYSDSASLGGSGISHLVAWRAGFGDMAVNNASGHQASIRYDTERRKLISDGAKSAKNGPVRSDGPFSFAGLEDQYFTASFLPLPNTTLQTTTFDDLVPTAVDSSDQPFPGVSVGGNSQNHLGIYVGPKELSALRKVNPNLENIIDWGWFGIIAKPLFQVLQWMTTGFVHNYGWSIILLTLMINVAMFPLRLANLKSMRKMQMLAPELAKINDKYKGIGMSDPKAANKQQETMDLYKKHGVNPMGGCIPMLIQMPFLYAFYRVLSVTIEMRNANWLWVADLSQPEHFAIRLLPIIMVGSSFLMQKMTPMAGGDPNQQKVMQFMPLMWGFMFWSASSGLVLYWLSSNLMQIAQQWFFNQTSPPVLAIATPANKTISSKDGKKRT